MGKFTDFLREQIRRSNATNFKTFSSVSEAIARKDILGVGSAVTGEITSAVKDITKEGSSIKQELKSELSKPSLDLKLPGPSKKELAELAKDPLYLKNIKKQTHEVCFCAVHNDGNALEFAQHQTPQICAEAIRNNPRAIQFVKNQTEDLCMQAVKRDGMALKHIRTPSLDVCKAAVQKNVRAVNFVPQQFIAHFSQALNQANKTLQKATRSTLDMGR